MTEEPTAAFGSGAGHTGYLEEPPPGGWRNHGRVVGEHRRDDGPETPRRWPWLATLTVLAVLAVSGLIWLVSSTLPHPEQVHQITTPAPSTDGQLSTPDDTGTGEPPASATATATPTAPPTVSLSGSLSGSAPAFSPVPPAASAPAPARTPAPTASRPPPSPTPVAVPDVVGKPESAATSILKGAGFSVAVVHTVTPERRQVNRVISQSPAAGQKVRSGSTVTITVGAPAST
jgi:hypothetical protein